MERTESPNCSKCGQHGLGTAYTYIKIWRECVSCGHRWVQVELPQRAPGWRS